MKPLKEFIQGSIVVTVTSGFDYEQMTISIGKELVDAINLKDERKQQFDKLLWEMRKELKLSWRSRLDWKHPIFCEASRSKDESRKPQTFKSNYHAQRVVLYENLLVIHYFHSEMIKYVVLDHSNNNFTFDKGAIKFIKEEALSEEEIQKQVDDQISKEVERQIKLDERKSQSEANKLDSKINSKANSKFSFLRLFNAD